MDKFSNIFNSNFLNTHIQKPLFYNPLLHSAKIRANTQSQQVNNFIAEENAQPKEEPKNIEEKAQIFKEASLKMDTQEITKYLQKALKLPKTIDETLTQLTNLSKGENAKLGILDSFLENLISVKVVSELISKNSTEAINKILQSISASLKSNNKDVSQLKDILNNLNAIQSSSQNTNAIKDLLLLYIPISPMVFNEEIDFRPLSGDEQEMIDTSYLSLMFETINFSNMLCCLNSESNEIFLTLYCPQEFPFDKFSQFVDFLAKQSSITLFFEPRILDNVVKDETKEPKQNLKVISKGNVPLEILLLSHIVAKTIFKIDSDY